MKAPKRRVVPAYKARRLQAERLARNVSAASRLLEQEPEICPDFMLYRQNGVVRAVGAPRPAPTPPVSTLIH